ncbi:outer membrane lipase/esterase [Pararobbsia alpina]|uniref:SGNH/GDSL hydrolase family protein n=1 Tax=Pararobbsia alpina TaxID=621374 RepID=UPI0039A49EB0
MKLSPTLTKTTLRLVQGAVAIALAATMTACGGGDDNNSSTPTSQVSASFQVVSFGDSLSDVGTYAPNISLIFGGGRFTTNPGQVWTQDVAQYYGGSLTAAQTGGFGAAVINNPNGYGYAQGGALVDGAQGNGWAANGAAALTVPVTQQIQNYISMHGTFTNNQLVFIQGGANDIIQQLTAASQGLEPLATAQANIATAAGKFVGAVAALLQAGATHVVVVDVPDIAKTPLAVLANDGGQTAAAFSAAVTAYNQGVSGALTSLGLANKVVQVSSFQFIDSEVANFAQNGFTVGNTGTACNLALMAQNAQRAGEANPSDFESSLFCSPQLYTVANADQTYMFADQIHPTTHLHARFAAYVEAAVNQAFGLK